MGSASHARSPEQPETGPPGEPGGWSLDERLPIAEGDRGEAVAEIQQRLGALGFDAAADAEGLFGPATRAALENFQRSRGLRIDGTCGRQTWSTLVEAGFRLGDRLLYRRASMLRGDDVAEVQQRLCALGFDTGRVDGIFGDQTAVALSEFQRNAGLPVDGIVGAETLRVLLRVRARNQAHDELVSRVRALEDLRQSPRTLSSRPVAVGEMGGLHTAVNALQRRLVAEGAEVTEVHHPDPSVHAQAANGARVHAYLGVHLDPAVPGCRTAYYAGYRDESPGGRRLAELIQVHVPGALGIPDLGTVGMSIPVLRETRMPAVVIDLGPAKAVVEQAQELASAVTAALAEWACSSWD